MLRIKFIVGLIGVAPLAVGSVVDTSYDVKLCEEVEREKHIKVVQRNFSTYMDTINTTTELNINFKQKDILISANVEGHFPLEKVITNIENEYIDESASAWNIKINATDFLFTSHLMNKSYFKMDWREYIAHNIFFPQNISKPFINFFPNISMRNENILGTNEKFYDITADIIYTKDGNTPYLFEDVNELGKKLPDNFFIGNAKGPLSSIPTIQLNVLRCDEASIGYFKMLDCNSIVGDVECNTYSLTDMFATKYITENTARFGITDAFRINDYEAHKRFSDMINNKLKFKLSYKTADVNDKNKLVNVSKTFLYDGMNLNIDLPINHGVFIPCSVESLEYSDDTIYIQPDYAKLN